jgi:hypothetical protein
MSWGGAVFVAVAGLVLALVAALALAGWRRARRAQFIREYSLPHGLYEALRERRPGLSQAQCLLANKALRQFFLAYLYSGRRYVAMPSRLADELWHAFILHTRAYGDFCRRAFGGILHHSPATSFTDNRKRNAGLRRVWFHACREDLVNPRNPERLPLLFALDTKVGIDDGFRYHLGSRPAAAAGSGTSGSDSGVHFTSDFRDDSIDGCTDGMDGADGSGAGDGGGDGGGCGGGCGGD